MAETRDPKDECPYSSYTAVHLFREFAMNHQLLAPEDVVGWVQDHGQERFPNVDCFDSFDRWEEWKRLHYHPGWPTTLMELASRHAREHGWVQPQSLRYILTGELPQSEKTLLAVETATDHRGEANSTVMTWVHRMDLQVHGFRRLALMDRVLSPSEVGKWVLQYGNQEYATGSEHSLEQCCWEPATVSLVDVTEYLVRDWRWTEREAHMFILADVTPAMHLPTVEISAPYCLVRYTLSFPEWYTEKQVVQLFRQAKLAANKRGHRYGEPQPSRRRFKQIYDYSPALLSFILSKWADEAAVEDKNQLNWRDACEEWNTLHPHWAFVDTDDNPGYKIMRKRYFEIEHAVVDTKRYSSP